jgi:hypothetical protein
MADKTRRVDYFSLELPDEPGEAFRILGKLKDARVSLLNCTGFPTGSGKGQMSVVPADPDSFLKAAKAAGLAVGAKKQVFLVQGTDRVGAAAELFKKLADAKVNVTAYNATCAPGGGFGMILWVKPQDLKAAAKALGV